MNIVKLTKSHELKQYAEEYTCFWYRNKNIGSLLYLAGRTVNRYRPDPCGSGVNILLHLPQKVNYDFLRRCFSYTNGSGKAVRSARVHDLPGSGADVLPDARE